APRKSWCGCSSTISSPSRNTSIKACAMRLQPPREILRDGVRHLAQKEADMRIEFGGLEHEHLFC
ncbi:MAG: hypothetical protein KKH37_02065, partial [Alphaproteobacteria bacterium]|nr:hypothetical protein [Alphaproteobacteria bacterium]